ncbi:NADH dehydrogenase [ubiquinone] 1 alpha subcomplex subunit 13-like [Convolutriloba macropyga]|uniref:NADH dehydrogenase [ubiquinone] 1 alpha subcomplex subunit 13-like n=1 Tax=Convolutriloba macropyga TaxID=536237 RepID=UPI003F51D4AB
MTAPKQEMPPVGGYPVFRWSRNLGQWARAGWGWKAAAALVGLTAWGNYHLARQFQLYKEYNREEYEVHQGIHALLVAETGRRMLRDLRESREVEAAVMKDNPDWIVGESQYYSRRWPHNIMGQISTDDVRTFESDGSKSQEITAELFLV